MKLMKKNQYGFDFILTKNLKIFTDCKEFFCDLYLFHYFIRLSTTGFYIYDKKKKNIFYKGEERWVLFARLTVEIALV